MGTMIHSYCAYVSNNTFSCRALRFNLIIIYLKNRFYILAIYTSTTAVLLRRPCLCANCSEVWDNFVYITSYEPVSACPLSVEG